MSKDNLEGVELLEEMSRVRLKYELDSKEDFHKTFFRMDKLIEKLQKENEKLRESLSFYAAKSNWWDLEEDAYCCTRITDEDTYKQDDKASSHFIFGGKLARETLKQLEGEK